MSHHGGTKRHGDQPKICEEGNRLCTPRFGPGPGGKALRHEFSCPAHPGERIDLRTYAKGRRSEWPRKGRIA